ncbi:MAG TPA: hypothetical protein VGZ47_17775 [Gemmataceae bacterium]|nr:hypothetical protein [Gemmataceae bacterium]
MLNVSCPHCQHTFLFDPATVWTSPGGITNLKGGTKVVIQCEKCKQWLSLELTVAKLEENPAEKKLEEKPAEKKLEEKPVEQSEGSPAPKRKKERNQKS